MSFSHLICTFNYKLKVMLRITTIITAFLISFYSYASQNYSSFLTSYEDDYLPKTIVLKVKPEYASLCGATNIEHPLFKSLSNSIGVINLHKIYPNDQPPGNSVNQYGEKLIDVTLIYELNYTADVHIKKAINKLLSSNILVYAEPHYIPVANYTTSDPLANAIDQYHLVNVRAFTGWDVTKGDSSIVIGISDTGIDYAHSDLSANIKRNVADPIDGIDNDADGYIDNYRGWDLANNDNNASWEANAHGVHVAGIAGASTDNANGIAGIGFKCKVLPIKISNSAGIITKPFESIKYAADHGCIAINCSWGGGSASLFGQDMIDYATINKNCVVVAAAGNNGADGDFFPAAFNHVFSVANTMSDDKKHSSSNYGYFVDVCAPGTQINATWTGGGYAKLTGTSMASPVVAGAIGLLKKQFPSYNGLQLAERLKVTADDIYALNPSYINKLGTGRINIYRALTDPPSPSVKMLDVSVTDHNDEMYLNGDTLFITGKFINYLNPTTALNVTLTPLSAYANTIDNTTSLGAIGMMSSVTNTLDPFKFKLTGALPVNLTIYFEVLMKDGVYQAKQYISVIINQDFINININDVASTATSNGKIGYNKDNQIQGLGFRFKGMDLLYDAGLMIGTDTTRVSDGARSTNPDLADVDFIASSKIEKVSMDVKSDLDTKAILIDPFAPKPLNAEVTQKTYTWKNSPNHQYIIWEYLVKNTHISDTLKNTYIGIYTDWDINGATYNLNRSAFDAGLNIGYSYYTGAGGKYGGVKLLTDFAPANFYAFDHVSGGAGGIDVTNGFDTKEKYKSLSTSRLAAGVSGGGGDISNVLSTGPFFILPGKSVRVAFAILGADSLAALKNNAVEAQIKYNSLYPAIVPEDPTSINYSSLVDESLSLYPNPVKDILICKQSSLIYNKIEIYNVTGTFIQTLNLTSNFEKINLEHLSNGMYLLKLIGNNNSVYRKISLTN